MKPFLCYNKTNIICEEKIVKLSLIHLMVFKKNLKALALLLFGIALIYAAVCTPLYHITNSNVLFEDGILSLILDYVMLILNFMVYWISFAFLLYVGITLGRTTLFKPVLLIIGLAILFFHFSNLIAGYCTVGFPTRWSVWSEELSYVGFAILLDAVQIAVAVLIVFRQTQTQVNTSKYFPVMKLRDKQNPVAVTAARLAAIPAVVHLITRIIFDIWDGYVPRDGGDLLWMILGYLSEILGFVAGYFVMILIINHLHMKTKKSEMLFEAEKGSILRASQKTFK